MALALVTPTGPVTSFPSGLIAIRCSDYPGPARGTLSVVADPLSVSGSVVRDTQTVAVPTTLGATNVGTQALLVSDSVRIPVADLQMRTNLGYYAYITLRTEGAPPTNALYKATWMQYSGISPVTGGSGGVSLGDNVVAYRLTVGLLPRSLVPNYVMLSPGQWTHAYSGPNVPTYLQFRAWGISGGTQVTYLDMIYLVPAGNISFTPDPGWDSDDINLDWGYAPTIFNSNDTVSPDQDNDATSAPWLGKFSVLEWFSSVSIFDGFADAQEADDEDTYWQHSPGNWETDPREHLAYIAGTTHMDPTVILNEGFISFAQGVNWDFNVSVPSWAAKTSSDLYYITGSHGDFPGFDFNYVDGGFVGGASIVVSGWEPDSGGFLRCYIPDGDTGEFNSRVIFGQQQFLPASLGGNTNDPRTYRTTAWIDEGCILTARFRIEHSLNLAYAAVGLIDRPDLASAFEEIVAELKFDASGNISLSLNHDRGLPHTVGSNIGVVVLDGPIALGSGYTLGDEWWIKIEKRAYYWRAKAWADGSAEPGWQLTGHELMTRNGAVSTGVLYPYDDNYGVDGTSVRHDPRRITHMYPMIRAMSGAKGIVGDDRVKVDCLSMKIEHDSGSGTPGDVETKTLRYDDSAVLDDAVTVPWGSHRWVYGPLKRRRFGTGNFDDLGFNVRVWKNSSFPDLTPAILGHVWERRVPGPLFIPQFYRRTHG